jgi:FlaA1/EpsC-like NDP-sugar epimerase
MTIPEAVGLVLVAGLRCEGDLCVLDMGEPVRIVDLARHLITLAGRIPEEEIAITFTGLRPGEKLAEEVLTEEEEETETVRDRIRVVHSRELEPPPRFRARLAELRDLARDGDADGIVAALQHLVPTYQAGAPGATGSTISRLVGRRLPGAALHAADRGWEDPRVEKRGT